MYMLQKERTDKILSLLNKQAIMTTEELMENLYCSRSTLRRDLLELERSGSITRVHGGAMLVDERSVEFPSEVRTLKHKKEKQYIASLAHPYIPANSIIFLDASTTVNALCAYLPEKNGVVVVTNSLANAQALSHHAHIQVYTPAGKISHSRGAILGPQTLESLNDFQFDLAFLSCKSVDTHGVYEANYEQALVKKKILGQSKQVLLLSDHSKIGETSFYKYANNHQIDLLLTDKNTSPDKLKKLGSNYRVEN